MMTTGQRLIAWSTRQAELRRCQRQATYFRGFVMTGELSPYVDASQPGAAVADLIGALVGMTDWEVEREMIARNVLVPETEKAENGYSGSEASDTRPTACHHDWIGVAMGNTHNIPPFGASRATQSQDSDSLMDAYFEAVDAALDEESREAALAGEFSPEVLP